MEKSGQRIPWKIRLQRGIIFFRRAVRKKVKAIAWLDVVLLLLSIGVGLLVYRKDQAGYLRKFDPNSVLSNLLVVNGVFSAVLMTFLFSRISWMKERKFEAYKEARGISQKITEFRRILYILTRYYGVWVSDKSTKNLFDVGKYNSVEFWELDSIYMGHNSKKKEQLIQELVHDSNYNSGMSALYLAMLSLVFLKGRVRFNFESELYHEFEFKGVYTLEIVERWINHNYFGKIWYWMNYDVQWINYYALKEVEKEKIKEAAVRINPKYASYELNNDLIEDIAQGFNTYYLEELQDLLLPLKRGIHSLNLLITILISCSLLFGVLLPLILLLLMSVDDITFREYVAGVGAVNACLICYFLLKFPFLINKELRFLG
jgi:hypothetical protein